MLTADKALRTLVIGIDAMEWTLVNRWSSEGKLPNLARMMNAGAYGVLRTTAEFLPDTAWTSMLCGANPGKLGKYFYLQYDQETGRPRYVPDTAIRMTPVWDLLGRAGKRVVVADMPHLPVSREPNVTHLLNWGAHDQPTSAESNPPALLDEVLARFGRHPVGDCETFNQDPDTRRRLARLIVEGTERQGELFRWLMQEKPWDVYMCCFSGAHCAGHQFWAQMDPAHPEHEQADPALRSTMIETYQAIDREIGKLVEEAGPDVPAIAIAGHGMLGLYHASWSVNELLDLLGYGEAGKVPRRSSAPKTARVNPWRLLKMTMPSSLQYAIKKKLPQWAQEELIVRWYAGGLRMQGRRAMCVPNNESSAMIRINLKGRDRNGLVEPGDEYRRVCEDIRDSLLSLTDPKTGRRVVRKISYVQEEYPGPHSDMLPDLGVAWDHSFPWESVESSRVGTLRIRKMDARSGSHSHYGFMVVHGPGVAPGEKLKGYSTYDLAPTLLARNNVPIPEELDGAPLPVLAAGKFL